MHTRTTTHYQGAGSFNAPIHALAIVRDQMAARGDLQDLNGTPVPAAEVDPTDLITPGTEVIDGVTFVFEAVSGSETTDQLLIRLLVSVLQFVEGLTDRQPRRPGTDRLHIRARAPARRSRLRLLAAAEVPEPAGRSGHAGARLLADRGHTTDLSAAYSAALRSLRPRGTGHDPGRVATGPGGHAC
ncbi:hypothetical protein [Streptomyces sp. NBC_00268]|uniref:hypothetical protein n=1 Tax=Streptomyces sp. NBC_00268 TaxID=2975695 RepID=UPI002259028E|nr:hypothetical protein [Streptomyces sp. NBC_00268]MCX5188873.1 hypothetical protein [Streptomyces sp. NBC_00268]